MSKSFGPYRTAFLVAALAIICSQAPFLSRGGAKPTADGQESLRIGSWNIQLLGSPERQPPQQADDLAKYIDFAKVDILALQEITPTGPAPDGFHAPFETSKVLTEVCAKLSDMQSANWKHILFPAFFNDPKEGKKQWVGVAWNAKKLTAVGSPVRVPVSNMLFQTGNVSDHLWKRNAHAMMFSAGKGKTDFVMIPVHMKSNRGVGNFRPHREAEAKELVKRLADLDIAFPGEKDIVILGDTNFLPDEDGLKEKARDVLVEANFKDLNADNVGTHLPGNKAPFDRFLVPKKQPEFQMSSQKILRDFLKQENLTQKKYIERFSDHLLIVAEIRIMEDDD